MRKLNEKEILLVSGGYDSGEYDFYFGNSGFSYDDYGVTGDYGFSSAIGEVYTVTGLLGDVARGIVINGLYDALKNGYQWIDNKLKAPPGTTYEITPEFDAIIRGNVTA
jgi:hypothetical protein